MPLKLISAGGGSVILSANSTGTNYTVTVPAINGTLITSGDSATVKPSMLSQPLSTVGSASLTGTSVILTGIPTWSRRVTIAVSYLQNNSSSDKAIQLGTSSSFVTSGYVGGAAYSGSSNAGGNWSGGIAFPTGAAGDIMHGVITLFLLTGNTWVISGAGGYSSSPNTWQLGGTVNLGGALYQIKFGSVGGTATWTQGTVNVQYE